MGGFFSFFFNLIYTNVVQLGTSVIFEKTDFNENWIYKNNNKNITYAHNRSLNPVRDKRKHMKIYNVLINQNINLNVGVHQINVTGTTLKVFKYVYKN